MPLLWRLPFEGDGMGSEATYASSVPQEEPTVSSTHPLASLGIARRAGAPQALVLHLDISTF